MGVDALNRNSPLGVVQLLPREFERLPDIIVGDVALGVVVEICTDSKFGVVAMFADVHKPTRERLHRAVVTVTIDMVIDAYAFPPVLLIC